MNRPASLTAIPGYEWFLLGYFMLHFFPPGPAALMNLCLFLGVLGVWLNVLRTPTVLSRWHHPLIVGTALLSALVFASNLQAPAGLQAAAWKSSWATLGKGLLFGLALTIHLDTADRARRLLLAGTLASLVMVIHCAVDTWFVWQLESTLPVPRDYLYWLLLFFPCVLGTYVLLPQLRWLSGSVAAAALALAVVTGFRGAMLALAIMLLTFMVFASLWRLLLAGALAIMVGMGGIIWGFPEQASHMLAKLQQVDSSNRLTGHWIPTWDLSLQSPWLGHGFGHPIFQQSYVANIPQHPSWTPMLSSQLGLAAASPHNLLLETLFTAGFPALLCLLALGALCIWQLSQRIWDQRAANIHSVWQVLATTVLVTFIGYFGVLSLFETPSWRSLPIVLCLAAACHRQLREGDR